MRECECDDSGVMLQFGGKLLLEWRRQETTRDTDTLVRVRSVCGTRSARDTAKRTEAECEFGAQVGVEAGEISYGEGTTLRTACAFARNRLGDGDSGDVRRDACCRTAPAAGFGTALAACGRLILREATQERARHIGAEPKTAAVGPQLV